jgi:hypothetical protein
MVKAPKKKPAVKKEKKATKKSVVVKTRTPAKPKIEKKTPVAAGLVATVVDTKGKAKGKITLAKEIFGEPANKQLVSIWPINGKAELPQKPADKYGVLHGKSTGKKVQEEQGTAISGLRFLSEAALYSDRFLTISPSQCPKK